MVDENKYQELFSKWEKPEERRAIAAEFLGEPSWWVATFAIDLCGFYGGHHGTEFATHLMELEDATR